MRYSPSTGCFYPDDIEYPDGVIPADAIETTEDVFSAWCSAAPGSAISVDGGEIAINPPPAPTLDQVKAIRIAALNAIYQSAAAAPLTFKMTSGATADFARDPSARAMVDLAVSQGSAAWTSNIWIDAVHQPVTPFTFADLEGLQAALAAPSSPSLSDFMGKVAAINSAVDAAAVEAVTF